MSKELYTYLNTVISGSVSTGEEGGGRDLVYNSRACIVCSLLVCCVFPSGVIGVRGWPGCHNGLLLWPCGHPT